MFSIHFIWGERVECYVFIIAVCALKDPGVVVTPIGPIHECIEHILIAVLHSEGDFNKSNDLLSVPTCTNTDNFIISEKNFSKDLGNKFINITSGFTIVELVHIHMRMKCEISSTPNIESKLIKSLCGSRKC